MRIALINPSVPKSLKKENLGLAYLSACLQRDGHQTRIIDEIAGQDVETGLDEFRPDIVGISFMTMYALRAYEITDRIKKERGLTVVMGGAHPTAMPEEALAHADCVIRGEAEWSFPQAISSGKLEGIIEPSVPPELDAIPEPRRDQLNLDLYAEAGEEIAGYSYRTLGIITSRGCPFVCNYCINSKRETKLRFHSPERVVEEIRYLVDRHHIESIAFFDELMATDIDRFRAICEAMIASGLHHLKWECQIHARRIRPDVLQLMKRAGCVQVTIGFESGSQRMLDRMVKHSTVDANMEAARNIHEAGLRVRGCFIIGTPGETVEDVELTRRFIRDAKIDFASLHYLTPYPGTALFDEFREEILESGITWDKFTAGDPDTFNCNKSMPPELQKRLFLKLSARQAFRNYTWPEMIKRAIRNPRHAVHVVSNMM
ncbi:MAG: B12-binding domain-containing radical SAM protein [Candidatus Hydrogenedentes bacterium]|nr:B12-binding domain-containing radical SAM protein [Candidatus Hydrogenedentota bacterium]